MSDLYCTTCSQFFDPIGMKQITEWKGRNRSTALFLDRRNGTCHEFLSEKHSNAKRKPELEPAVTINVPVIPAKTGEVPAPTSVEQAADVDQAIPQTREEVVTEVTTNEGGESLEFEDWSPKPSEYFYASVITVRNTYLLAQLSNQEVVFVSGEVMRPPQHPTTCEVGDVLHVCISLNKKEGARAKWWAHDAWKEERSEEDEVVRF